MMICSEPDAGLQPTRWCTIFGISLIAGNPCEILGRFRPMCSHTRGMRFCAANTRLLGRPLGTCNMRCLAYRDNDNWQPNLETQLTSASFSMSRPRQCHKLVPHTYGPNLAQEQTIWDDHSETRPLSILRLAIASPKL
jgi:hypothetical protein